MARKILLADDSVTAQNMGRRILTDAGYEVVTVNNGSAALKKIAEQLPELIVLDVYMPGYSGLEVCQRLKETRETARIPVLLTVGKLEPFKPEDARRARADAFIIKPFEASELLTALTKLEDKIVPQPATSKAGGQFAKVWASLEHGPSSPDKGEKFGDSETGWKNRLTIPPPNAKHEEPEPEEAKPAKAAKDSKKQEKSGKKEKETPSEAPTIAGVPPDITPEEVAAIAAAAAAFEDAQPAPREFAVTEAEVPDDPPATFASAPSTEEESKPVEVEAVSKMPAATEPAKSTEEKAPEKPAEVRVEAVAEVPAASTEKAESKAAEIAPAEPVVAAVAAAPRWVAEECGLEPGETNVILEEEMRKAYAVLQAATSEAHFSATAVSEAPVPAVTVEVPAPLAVAVEAPVAKEPEAPVVESKPEPEPVVETKPEPAPEPVAETKSEPAPEPVVETQPEPEPAPAAEVPAPEPEPEPVAAVAEAKVEPEPVVAAVAETSVQPEAAVAAAASAGSAASEPAAVEAVSQPAVSPNGESEVAEAKPADTELAAAWAQWKEIRESVVGSGIAAQITEVATALKQAEAEAKPSEDASPTGNPANIANIVDSVLAELKPKLVEEIAKKLGKEKKK